MDGLVAGWKLTDASDVGIGRATAKLTASDATGDDNRTNDSTQRLNMQSVMLFVWVIECGVDVQANRTTKLEEPYEWWTARMEFQTVADVMINRLRTRGRGI